MSATPLQELERLADGPDTDRAHDAVFSRMEARFAEPGGAAELVARFAGSDKPILVRTLTFLLARAASRRTLQEPIGPLILAVVAAWRCADDAALTNLLSAVHLSSMHGELLAPGQGLPDALLALLVEVAGGAGLALAALVGAVAVLHAQGDLARASPERVEPLREALTALRPVAGSALERELDDLRSFLSRP